MRMLSILWVKAGDQNGTAMVRHDSRARIRRPFHSYLSNFLLLLNAFVSISLEGNSRLNLARGDYLPASEIVSDASNTFL